MLWEPTQKFLRHSQFPKPPRRIYWLHAIGCDYDYAKTVQYLFCSCHEWQPHRPLVLHGVPGNFGWRSQLSGPQWRDVDGSAAMVTMAIQTKQSYREKQNTHIVYILDINHISLMNFLDREISAINSPQQFLNSNPLVSLFDHEPHFTTLQRSVCRKTLETSSVLWFLHSDSPLSKPIFVCQVHQVEPQNGRISFDIDPSATGLVLREARASGASQRHFLLNSVGGIDSWLGTG